MRASLSGGEYQVVLTVIDSTWGYRKESAFVSLSHFEEATGLSRKGITKAIKSVETKHILAAHRNGTKGTEYIFNKHYDTWTILPASEPQYPSNQAQLVNAGTPASEEVLVNQSSPDWCTGVHQTSEPQYPSASELPTPTPEPGKKRKVNLKVNIKEIVIAPTSDESKKLDILRSLKGWRYDQADDLAWLRDFTQEFAGFDLAHLRATRDYHSGRAPPKHKGGWKNRFRNWMSKKKEFEKGGPHADREGRQPPGRGAGTHQRGDQEPSAERYRQSLEGDRFSGFHAIESGPDEPDGGDEDSRLPV